MYDKDILLENRYGNRTYLRHISDNEYELIAENSYYFSVSMKDDVDYNFVDPEGGPFLSVEGTIMSNGDKPLRIDRIYKIDNKIILSLKDEQDDN